MEILGLVLTILFGTVSVISLAMQLVPSKKKSLLVIYNL